MTDQLNNLFDLSEDKLALLDLLLADEGIEDSVSIPNITPRADLGVPVPLSFAQQRLYFLETLSPGTALFNTPLALRFTGKLDRVSLTRACQTLVQRHENLRTTFTAVSGTPQQIVHKEWPVTLETIQATVDSPEELLKTAMQRPFDLAKGPLLRFHLLQCSQTEHVLLIVFHHIIVDGWSVDVVVDELATLYEAFVQQRRPELPDLPIQYADYAVWQREWLAGETLQAQLDYWQNQLAGDLPLLQLPIDKPRPAVKTHHGANETILLSPEITQQVQTLCQQTDTTPFMLLLAAFQVLLHRYTAQEDILVGTPIGNRPQPELAGLVGFFVNTLVLRSQVDGWQTFRQLLAQVRRTATAAYDHADVPFEKLVELLQPERNLSYDPIFQVMFTYRDAGWSERPLPNLTVMPMALDNGIAQFDLTLAVSREDTQLQCTLNYNSDLFAPETIQRMLRHWQTLLTGMLAHPARPVGEIVMLTPLEWQKMVVDWNETAVPLPEARFFHEHVAQWAAQTPDAIALLYGQQQMSYATLNSKANQLAHALQGWGVGPESRVGIFINRSFEMIIGMLAVQKAGGAYVPLDPAYPAERLDYMMRDANLALVLTTTELREKLPTGQETAVVCLEQDWAEQIAQQPTSNPTTALTTDNLAYIIYTSGSTGRPKGVGVTHRGVVNLAHALQHRLAVSPQSRVLQFASFSFDASVAEIVEALQNGATLVLADKEALLMGPSFVDLMQHQAISVVTLPPSALALLNPDDFPALRTIVSAGEACSAEVVAKWSVNCRFINGYGPTEGTVGAITAVLDPDDPQPLLGRPLPNYQIYLLNSQLQPVPVGVAGEIHIAGLGLARGYLNRPDLTAEKFIANPFSSGGNKMYKTGDLGRYLPDGRIDYLGRIDHQVKIRGFRIEIDEVEAAIRQHQAVRDVLVLPQQTEDGSQLMAYVVGDASALADLRPFLNQSLPAYMMPAVFITLDQFPQTPNGKIDRKALPVPAHQTVLWDDAFMAPQDALESQLVQIWQEVLKLPSISTKANYFEIGGHSLQAVTLFSAIEKRLKLRLPVSLLFKAPTIRQLAATIREGEESPRWSSLVPIQPLGSKTPLFCVHGGAGHVFHYHDLAQLLGTERPFYGIQPKTDPITDQAIYQSVEEMAAHYIREIKMVQPTGPYLLSGFCFGGIVVYEMAQQLKRAGDEVGLLVFIDPSTPTNKPTLHPPPPPEELEARLSRHKENMAQLGRLARLGYILNSGKNRLIAYWYLFYRAWLRDWRKIRSKLVHKYVNWQQKVPSQLSDFYFMNVISEPATRQYHPKRYPGEVVLFFSTLENGGDETLGWSGLPTENLIMHKVESTHLGILKRPFIDQVAAKLKKYLEPFA